MIDHTTKKFTIAGCGGYSEIEAVVHYEYESPYAEITVEPFEPAFCGAIEVTGIEFRSKSKKGTAFDIYDVFSAEHIKNIETEILSELLREAK